MVIVLIELLNISLLVHSNHYRYQSINSWFEVALEYALRHCWLCMSRGMEQDNGKATANGKKTGSFRTSLSGPREMK